MTEQVTNKDRVHWAARSLQKFMELTGCEREDALGDLLCDLMHWARQNGYDFDFALQRAYGHFEEELAEAGDSHPRASGRLADARRFMELMDRLFYCGEQD